MISNTVQGTKDELGHVVNVSKAVREGVAEQAPDGIARVVVDEMTKGSWDMEHRLHEDVIVTIEEWVMVHARIHLHMFDPTTKLELVASRWIERVASSPGGVAALNSWSAVDNKDGIGGVAIDSADHNAIGLMDYFAWVVGRSQVVVGWSWIVDGRSRSLIIGGVKINDWWVVIAVCHVGILCGLDWSGGSSFVFRFIVGDIFGCVPCFRPLTGVVTALLISDLVILLDNGVQWVMVYDVYF